MQNLHGLTFYLMITDAIGSDENLTARMGMPCIDDSWLKYHVVQARATSHIIVWHGISQADRAVEGR